MPRALMLGFGALIVLVGLGSAAPAAAADPYPMLGQAALPPLPSDTLPQAPEGSSSNPLLGAGIVAPLAAGGQVKLLDTTRYTARDMTSLDDTAQQPTIVDVTIRDDFFEPQVITITVGSAVRWTNRGSHVHSTTSVDGYWNWALQPGFSYGVRFLSAGSFEYDCVYHDGEGSGGTVVVLPGAAVTPPVPGPTVTPQPTPPPGTLPGAGAIVYDYFADEAQRGQSELYVVEPDGGAPQRLTSTTLVSEAQPSWSPTKREVAYAARQGAAASAPWGISVLDLATGMSRALSAGPADFEPDWHPGGAWVAYTHVERGVSGQRSEIRMTAADGSLTRVLVRLDSNAQVVADPSWAPDGQSLVFTVGGLGGGDLYRWVPGRIERIAGAAGSDDIDPTVSPDGRYLAYASGSAVGVAAEGVRHEIWLHDLTTGQRGAVATHPDWDLRRPAWSPNGSELVFTARFDRGPDRWALYTVPATGGPVSGPLAVGVEPDWAATGRVSLPTPMPGATATAPAPPAFPTPMPTEPILATPTSGPPPTFPPPIEPTPTMEPPSSPTPGQSTPTASAPTPSSPTATPGVTVGRIFLPLTLRNAIVGGGGTNVLR